MSSLVEIFKTLKPLNGKIIAEIQEKKEKKLESGIILSGESVNQAMEDLRKAVVIKSDNDKVKPGDVIYYLRFVGTPVGEEVIVLTEDDVLGVEDDG